MANLIKSFIETDYNVASTQAADNVLFCEASVILHEFQQKDFENIRLIPEKGDPYKPTINGTYQADGFYCSVFSDKQYWYKVSDGGTVEIMPNATTGVEIIAKNDIAHCKLLGKTFSQYENDWQPKDKPHYTKNPFDI